MVRFLASHANFALRCVGLALAFVSLASFTVWARAANANDAQVEQEIRQAQQATQRGAYATDGIFQGEAEGYGGPVCVQVTIENGYITNVELISAENEDQAWLNMALPLLDVIVQQQTTHVDVVSGATFSSSGILNGATRALSQSGLASDAAGDGTSVAGVASDRNEASTQNNINELGE